MICPIDYYIAKFSTNEKSFPVTNIKRRDKENVGWSSVRYCHYPQEIFLKFSNFCDIKQINFLFNHQRIPSRVDIFAYCPDTLGEVKFDVNRINFSFVGHIVPTPHETPQRELKKVPFQGGNEICHCLMLKLEFRENYPTKANQFNQVGLVSLEVLGWDSVGFKVSMNGSSDVKVKCTDEIFSLLVKDEDFVPDIAEKLYYAKQRYYSNPTDRGIYDDINDLRYFGRIIHQLNAEKSKRASRLEDSSEIDKEISDILSYIDSKYLIYGNERIIYENKDYKKIYLIDYEIISESEKTPSVNGSLGGEDFIIQNKEVQNMYELENPVKVSPEMSQVILNRFRLKKKMIQNSLNQARENLKYEGTRSRSPGINL